MTASYLPRARKVGLQIQELPAETLVFDTENEHANCLNATAAFVWKQADGTRSVADIATAMSKTLETSVEPRVVWYALDQLAKKNLLQERVPLPPEYAHMTRRAFLRAGAVGAAVAIPVIISLAAPSPAHAQSACMNNGQSCITGEDCCSECCAGSICAPFSACL